MSRSSHYASFIRPLSLMFLLSLTSMVRQCCLDVTWISFVSIFPICQFGLISLIFRLCAKLTVLVSSIAHDEVLWDVFRQLGSVFSCSMSVWYDYITDGVCFVDVTENIMDGLHIRSSCAFMCRLCQFGRWLGASHIWLPLALNLWTCCDFGRWVLTVWLGGHFSAVKQK